MTPSSSFTARLHKRLRPFADLGFWLLTILSLVPLLIINRPMAVTLLQWCAFFLALAGASIVITRIMLPQVDLKEWLDDIRYRSNSTGTGAGLVVLSVALVLSATLVSMVLWAKA